MSSHQTAHTFEKEITTVVGCKYLLFLPKDYDARAEPWPLILFLHGMGERGDDLELIKKHGMPKIVEEREVFPFVVVSPQCPEGQQWSNEVLFALLDEIESKYRVDPERFYLTGLSMGGLGTWNLAIACPHRFAAIAPICAPAALLVNPLADLPVWVFHGAKDSVVPVQESERMVRRIEQSGGQVRFTVYPEADHDAWTETYNNPELYEWFLQHRRH